MHPPAQALPPQFMFDFLTEKEIEHYWQSIHVSKYTRRIWPRTESVPSEAKPETLVTPQTIHLSLRHVLTTMSAFRPFRHA
jgi:hypothetical protein